MAKILKGAPVAEALNARTAAQVEALEQRGIIPTLAVVRVGERGDDIAYERGIMARCEKVGVAARVVPLPAGCAEAALVDTLKALNADDKVHGVLLFRPLPKHINDDVVRNTLAPEKDIDGITDASLAEVFTGRGPRFGTGPAQQGEPAPGERKPQGAAGAPGVGGPAGFAPCTAAACMAVLAHYGYDCGGKRAVVVGRSLTVGKPAAMLLLGQNATVTVCHTRTADMPARCREADILIVSAGQSKMVDAAYLAPGQVVIDVGINVDDAGKMCGDVDFKAAEGIVAAVTPVPAGVGTVTTSLLVGNVVEAAARAAARQ